MILLLTVNAVLYLLVFFFGMLYGQRKTDNPYANAPSRYTVSKDGT